MQVKGNLVVGQSGGPTMVINQSLVGIVNAALDSDRIGEIYGARSGVVGIMEESFVDLRGLSREHLEEVADTPGSALGACRYKPDERDCERVFDVFRKYDVHYFFYIGGNDSAESADIINTIARDRKYELRIFHVPKTIDNDLRVTDHCPGYGSAARYVAITFLGDDVDNHSLPGIKINVVMGRGAGWLTAGAFLARLGGAEGPHLGYFPERAMTLEKLTSDIDRAFKRHGRAVIAVSEGLKGPDGKYFLESESTEKDAYGNPQLSGTGALGSFLVKEVKARLGEKLRVRADTLGYVQRTFPAMASEVDAREARMVGEAAVKYALSGDIDGTVIIRRTGEGEEYAAEAALAPLSEVARVTKKMPDEFLNEEGNGVTEAFIRYAAPLVGKLPKIAWLNANSVRKRS